MLFLWLLRPYCTYSIHCLSSVSFFDSYWHLSESIYDSTLVAHSWPRSPSFRRLKPLNFFLLSPWSPTCKKTQQPPHIAQNRKSIVERALGKHPRNSNARTNNFIVLYKEFDLVRAKFAPLELVPSPFTRPKKNTRKRERETHWRTSICL